MLSLQLKTRIRQYRFGLELANLLNAETTTVSKAGHMLPMESPKNTLDAIKSFILKNSG